MIRATFDVEPPGWNEAFSEWRAVEVGRDGRRILLEIPDDNWDGDVAMLVSALVAGEVMEVGGLSRCRLVDLDLGDGALPGPAFGTAAQPANAVGVIVKPSLGLAPHQVADVARAAIAGGARLIKDDETLGDPRWCPFDERVAAVAKILEPGVVYCANVTGPSGSLVERARRAVELGATGLLVNPFAMGLGALVALRQEQLGVPILAHRAGSGPWAHNGRFGATGAVLARLTRLCGADYLIAGAYGGKLFETDAQVDANVAAAHEPCGSARPSIVALGGGLGPDDVAGQVERAGAPTAARERPAGAFVVLLGTRAQRYPGGLEVAVRRAVSALG